MAKFQIMPTDKEKIAAYNQQLSEQVELYKTYDVSHPEVNVHYDNTKELTGGVIYIGEFRYMVSHPSDVGFVVKRDWSIPTEPDPVLKAWGNYEDVDFFRSRDSTLTAWFERAYAATTGGSVKPEIKITHRLRSFSPRRSERFKPKITLYQSASDRFDRDREVAMKPARAFTTMFPELEHKQVIYLTDEYLNRFSTRELSIKEGSDAKDFVKAYSWTQAPTDNINTTHSRKSSASSCMRYDFDHLSVHPVTAYASGDFQMLWTEDADGKIASRCVVRVMPDGQYRGGPIYGVSEQAIDLLEHHIWSTPNGEYGKDGAWVGARLLRQPVNDRETEFYAPYIDPEPRRLADTGEYLVIDDCGCIDANAYQGVLGEHEYHCASCGCGLHDDESYYSEYLEDSYCNDCYYNEHFYCEYSDRDCHHEEGQTAMVPVTYGGGWDEDTIWSHYVETEFVYTSTDGNYWHPDLVYFCADQDEYINESDLKDGDYFISDDDGEVYSSCQSARLEDGSQISCTEAEQRGLVHDVENNIWKEEKEND